MKKLKWISLSLLLLLVAAVAVVGLTFSMPEFAGMDQIEIQGMEGKQLAATLTAKIHNPNFYSLGARKLDYIVTYHDTLIGRGSLPDGLSLTAGDTSRLQLPVKLELNGIFAVHKSMLKRDKCKIDIHLDAEFTYFHFRQGLDLSTEIAPEKFIQQVLGNSLGSDDLELVEMKWKSTKLQTSEFSFVSVVKNPLDIPLDLQSLELKLHNEGSKRKAGEWKLEKPMTLKPKYSTRLPGSIEINHLNAGLGVVNTIFTGELRFDAEGIMVLQLAGLPFEIPLAGRVVIDPRSGSGHWEQVAGE